jgi:chromosome segregation ATPase
VARANGERTNKEAKQLQEETEKVEDEKKKIKDLYDQVDDALKQLADEKRNLERRVKQKEEEREKLIKNIEKFNLENDMTLQELKKIVKNKEDAMVSHDIMKLEIKKIQDRLNDAQNEVLGLENKKNQLELSMGEREKEISVHNSVLTAEYKAAEKERHKTAVELAERENKVRNLKIKYESLIQRKQGSEATNVHEHSQAYYIIKAA